MNIFKIRCMVWLYTLKLTIGFKDLKLQSYKKKKQKNKERKVSFWVSFWVKMGEMKQ